MTNQYGNALFLILIAVALFAALSYAVTQSGRGGGDTTREKNTIIAAQIVQRATMLENTISRLKLVNGCTDDEISFERDGTTGYENLGTPGDSCKVFHADGGRLNYTQPPSDWLDSGSAGSDSYGEWVFIGERVDGVGDNCVATECADLLTILPYIPKSMCLEINRQLGVPEYSGDPPQENDNVHVMDMYYFTGAGSWQTYQLSTGNGKGFAGERSACVEGGSTPSSQVGQYFFYHVLIAR